MVKNSSGIKPVEEEQTTSKLFVTNSEGVKFTTLDIAEALENIEIYSERKFLNFYTFFIAKEDSPTTRREI